MFKGIGLGFLVVMAGLAFGCNSSEPAKSVEEKKVVVGAENEATPTNQSGPSAAELAAAECKVAISVDKMVCNKGCPPAVMQALEGVAGVSNVEVDFPNRRAEVLGDHDVCSEPGSQKLIDALKARNYGGKVESIEPVSG